MQQFKNLILGMVCLTVLLMAFQLHAQEKDGFRVQYKVGDGLYIGDGSNLVHISARVQARFTYTGLEQTSDTETFAIQRGKIAIDGFTLDKLIKYKFQMNMATRNRATTTSVCTNAACTATAAAVTTESTSGLPQLEDFWVDYVPKEYVGLRVGQFKVPFLMQQLTSSGRQQFVDRSLATGFFDFGYDLGAALHGDLFERKLNYSVFVMNGDGVNTINRNQSVLAGARFEVPLLGEYKASESDVDNSQEQNLGFGVAYAFNQGLGSFANGSIPADTKTSHGTFDLGYKFKGFSFQGAGMLQRTHGENELTNWGYNAQVGYFLVPKTFEVALRTDAAIFSNAIRNQYEHAVALNYFIKGHGIKLQTDYSLIMNNRAMNLNDHRVRTQMQVVF